MVDETSRRQGWDLVYHSASYLASAISYFEDLPNDDGELKRPLTPDEKRFIQNERKLCALDFVHWATNFAKIVNWHKQPELFTPNVAQQIELAIWAEFEEAGRAIHVQNLKARRLGVSTLCELATQHAFQFIPYSNCVIASADPGKSVLMGEMINFSHEHQPWWLLPVTTKVSKGIPAEFGEIHTGLTIQAGNQFNGVARGATPNKIHLSELAEWVAAESLVDAALYRAIIDTPDVFCILESTAEGRGNWWHRTWEQNKRDWDRGRGRVRPVFLPWYVGTDLYPSETDLRARPIPSDWTPSDRSVRHAERARDYVRHSPLLMKYLAKGDTDWKLSPAQMWYHEIEYETALAKKELNIFMSELPADDIEAFQSEAVSVIDQEIILNYRERVREPWGVFTILGADIPQSLTVPRRQWDMSREPITIRTSGVLRLNEVFRLQPVLWDGNASGGDPAMKLFVWEPPEDGEVYGIGIDTGDGIGEDGTAMEGIRKGSPLHVPAQVFEFQSAYIKAFQLWPMALALGCWYSTFNTMAQRRVQCRVAIECKGNGEATQHEMQKRGWSNFHPWKRYDSRKRLPDGKTHKIGVFTSEWFRSQMMDYILTLIDEESLDVPSPWLVDEMASIERDPDQQKAQASYGEHDDRFMAIAFILFSLYVDEIGKHRYNHRRPPSMDVEAHAPSLTGDEGGYAVWSPGAQAFEVGRPRLNTRV
jgi:hypothetical protein